MAGSWQDMISYMFYKDDVEPEEPQCEDVKLCKPKLAI